MKKFKEFKVTTYPFQPDLIGGILWDFDISGINIEEDHLVVYAAQESGLETSDIESKLDLTLKNNLIESYAVEDALIENKNWNKEWEKNIKVQEISERIIIKPSFREYQPLSNQIVITIDPKMSFGTGEHETTRIMLRLLEEHLKTGDSVLDAGTGTGILAIAAAKLGAKSVLAFDNDEWCVTNTGENLLLNSVKEVRIQLARIEDIEETGFDIVLANINKNVLLDIKSGISERLNDSGLAILSGFLAEDVTSILKIYMQSGFISVDKLIIKEWAGIVLKKINRSGPAVHA